jgi:hypothetical protein
MIQNNGNAHNYHLIAAVSLGLGIASLLLLISNHLDYAYGESSYIIKSKLNGLVLDIRASDFRPGAFVQTWTQNNGLNQQWIITDDGFIKSKLNGLVLEIRAADPRPGAFIQMWTQNNGLGQQWTITDDGFIKSKLNGLVLDIRASNPIPGTLLQTWTQNNGLGQQWILEKFPESTSNNFSNVTG